MDFALIPEPKKRQVKTCETYVDHTGFVETWTHDFPTDNEYVVLRRVPMDRVSVREPELAYGYESYGANAVWWRVFRRNTTNTAMAWAAAEYPDAEQRAIAECARLNAAAKE